MLEDISPNFVYNEPDAIIVHDILRFEKTPFAIEYFAQNYKRLSDYAYWFTLGTLWVSYPWQTDLNRGGSYFVATVQNETHLL